MGYRWRAGVKMKIVLIAGGICLRMCDDLLCADRCGDCESRGVYAWHGGTGLGRYKGTAVIYGQDASAAVPFGIRQSMRRIW